MPLHIQAIPAVHRQKNILIIKFPYDKELIKRFKQLKGAAWSNTLKSWYLPDNTNYRHQFNVAINPLSGKNVLTKIALINKIAWDKLKEELVLKKYSASTQKTYLLEFAQLLYVLKEKNVANLTYEKLRKYFAWCINDKKISANQLNSRINAIKFYYEKVLKREKFSGEIPRPKKPLLLPKVISEKDIIKLLASPANVKHKLLLSLCYGMGLRVSEICALKINHIDSSRMQVHISGAKGKKDRYVNLPHSILTLLRKYYIFYRPKTFLFEGQYGGPYSIRSAQQVFKQCLQKAGINKNVGIHSLRHSFATHLMENGTDVSFIQKILGHNNIKTTLRYTYVSQKELNKIESPLDKISREK